ncbi:hypothetical protein GCM10027289_23040 [Tsukamurella serpentis]
MWLIVAGLAGCTVHIGGVPVADTSQALPTPPLPFTPGIRQRTNERNNGSTFEPCTAYSPAELSAVRVKSETVSDAAQTDSPNFRGCHWSGTDNSWRFSQIVGNEESLRTYKTKQRDRVWLPDQTVNERTVGVALDPPLGCFAAFMSDQGIVVTTTMSSTKRTPEPDFKTECEMAVAFATLATTKAP